MFVQLCLGQPLLATPRLGLKAKTVATGLLCADGGASNGPTRTLLFKPVLAAIKVMGNLSEGALA
ncbi:hypothetical protein GCM10011297_07250 [Bacterioplanes sanyensis]|nr:hypothetical protein GCM10011297_07250 [Bacterioplanes sanyensis]